MLIAPTDPVLTVQEVCALVNILRSTAAIMSGVAPFIRLAILPDSSMPGVSIRKYTSIIPSLPSVHSLAWLASPRQARDKGLTATEVTVGRLCVRPARREMQASMAGGAFGLDFKLAVSFTVKVKRPRTVACASVASLSLSPAGSRRSSCSNPGKRPGCHGCLSWSGKMRLSLTSADSSFIGCLSSKPAWSISYMILDSQEELPSRSVVARLLAMVEAFDALSEVTTNDTST
mmetsp:Transcript_67026/g.195996  ORF Transcript_67026/g.195996 Transcript_67026/m.195996 type:complete len:232 (-) Transcript_67026:770-1465(-)